MFSTFINDAHHLAIRILNKVFQLVPFITLSSFSVGNVGKYALAFFFKNDAVYGIYDGKFRVDNGNFQVSKNCALRGFYTRWNFALR